jgi:hypothetical protein
MSTEQLNFDDLYGSRYLSASDLHGETPRRKIGKVEVAELKEKDGTTKKKFVLFFAGEDKSLVLNKTNARRLAEAFTKDPTKWVGEGVELYSETTTFGEGVRLRCLKKQQTAAAKPNLDAELNDAIPF